MKKLLLILFVVAITNIASAASESHVYVLVHGAWHGNWTFYKLQYELEKAGHAVININLPGHGLDTTLPGNVTLDDYTNAIVGVLDTTSKPVVLVGHSMGGIAISMAAEARPEKIDKLVYLAAFMPKNGQSMIDLALQDTLSMIGPSLIIDTINKIVDLKRENISAIFYDSFTAEYVLLSEMLLKPNPLLPIVTPLTLSEGNYGSVRRFYISTSNDQAITPAFQEKMYTEQACEKVYSINTEHSPFFSAPGQLKNILDKIGDDDKALKSNNRLSQIKTQADIGIQVYANSPNQISVESATIIREFRYSIYSLDGKLLFHNTIKPTCATFKVPHQLGAGQLAIIQIEADGLKMSHPILLK